MKAKIYLYVIQHRNSEGVGGIDAIPYTDYKEAKKRLLSDYEANTRLESCSIEYRYEKELDIYEEPPRVNNWIFESPLMYIRTFSDGGKYAPSSWTERAIFEKEIL